MLDAARAPCIRPILRFAEEEIVLAKGPYAGRRFNADRQPFARLWLDALDQVPHTRSALTGPGQAGKSLLGLTIPVLHSLFELRETTILAAPDMYILKDKWLEDVLPVIERQESFRKFLPRTGGGSQGGFPRAIHFHNGTVLRFMTGGSGDKGRSHYTSRIVIITEVDGMDEASETSREADPISQLENRVKAYGNRKSIALECTVSIATGRIWREYQAGTRSRILLLCPHCRRRIVPDRKDLVGWQDAETKEAARRQGAFACPACAALWTEEDRYRANLDAVLIHRGQTVTDDGQVAGPLPDTDTLSLRFSAVNDFFSTAGDAAAEEWAASREVDEENAERKMCQFIWAIPFTPSVFSELRISAEDVIGRMGPQPRGLVPRDAAYLTMGIDLGKWTFHWALVAWTSEGRGHVVDYGKFKTNADLMAVDKAVHAALGEIREIVELGWTWEDHEKPRVPDQVWIDSNYQQDAVFAFIREAGSRFMPTIGRGSGQERRLHYNKPRTLTGATVHVGDHFHIVQHDSGGVYVVEIDADHWKTSLHERLSIPIESVAAIVLCRAMPREHLDFAKQLTAEEQVARFDPKRGLIVQWHQKRSNNHWFDACYNAAAAASFCGLRTIVVAPPSSPQPDKGPRLTSPDGRPYLITER